MKPKTPSFLSRKVLLTRKEESDYQANKGNIQRRRFLNENKQLDKQNTYESKRDSYNKSRAGRFSNVLSKGIRTVGSRGGVTRSLYGNQLPPNRPTVNRGINSGRKGRPVGTVKHYDDQGHPIGVYDWRRLQAMKNRQTLQRAIINPQQQQVLNAIERRDAYNAQNEEAKTIPSTKGNVPLGGIMDEIDRATHLFD